MAHVQAHSYRFGSVIITRGRLKTEDNIIQSHDTTLQYSDFKREGVSEVGKKGGREVYTSSTSEVPHI